MLESSCSHGTFQCIVPERKAHPFHLRLNKEGISSRAKVCWNPNLDGKITLNVKSSPFVRTCRMVTWCWKNFWRLQHWNFLEILENIFWEWQKYCWSYLCIIPFFCDSLALFSWTVWVFFQLKLESFTSSKQGSIYLSISSFAVVTAGTSTEVRVHLQFS